VVPRRTLLRAAALRGLAGCAAPADDARPSPDDPVTVGEYRAVVFWYVRSAGDGCLPTGRFRLATTLARQGGAADPTTARWGFDLSLYPVD
jgi:hypothetical protein